MLQSSIFRKEDSMTQKAFQDYYDDSVSQCYGCGRLNEYGLQIKSYWDGDEAVCHFPPQPYHTAIPGYVYGGLLASLVDCHATGAASAAAYRQAGRAMGTEPAFRYVTGTLTVKYLKPTPIDANLELRARVTEIKDRRAKVEVGLYAHGQKTVEGEVVVFQMPEDMLKE